MTSPFPPLPIIEGCCTIPLTRGKSALVDVADWPELSRRRWHASPNRRDGRCYAVRFVRVDGRSRKIAMHRHLAGDPPGLAVDHANDDSLDDRRSNLRPGTRPDNGANQQKRRRRGGTTSRWKGVSRSARGKPWQVHACRGRRRFHLGMFDIEAEGAVAFNAAAAILHGPFARPNVIPAELAPTEARRLAIAREVERRLARAERAA